MLFYLVASRLQLGLAWGVASLQSPRRAGGPGRLWLGAVGQTEMPVMPDSSSAPAPVMLCRMFVEWGSQQQQ